MYLDAAGQLCSQYAPTSTGTAYNTNIIDLQAPGNPASAVVDGGVGEPWVWFTQVNTTFTSGGSATLGIVLQGNATDSTFGSGNVTVAQSLSQVIPVATLVKGFYGNTTYGTWRIPYPMDSLVRFLRFGSVIATAAMTAGSLDSWLLPMQVIPNQHAYPNNYTTANG